MAALPTIFSAGLTLFLKRFKPRIFAAIGPVAFAVWLRQPANAQRRNQNARFNLAQFQKSIRLATDVYA